MPKDDSKPRKDKKDKKDKKEKKEKKSKKVVVEEEVVVTAPSSSSSPEPTPDVVVAPAPSEPVASSSSDSFDDEADVPKREQVDDGTLLEIDPDAPAPLSRAALRKAKSNPALAAAASTEEATPSTKGKEKAAAGTSTDNKPGKYSVWVGNLAFRTTEAELREYFRPALTLSARKGKGKATTTEDGAEDKDGEPSSASSSSSDEESDAEDKEQEGEKKAPPQPTVTRVNLPRTKTQGNRPGVNKGFAYVDFSNWASQQAAVKLSEGHLHGRALLIKAATDFTNRPEAPKAALASLPEGQTKSKSAQALLARQRNPVGPTLFVGNLGFEATEEGLRSLIAAHWETSLSNAKRHAQKAPRSNFLPESETTEGDGADKEGEAVEGGEKEDEGKGGEEAVVGLAAGIRKVRMAQFQDSGKCKGFAFLDFFTPAQATAALIDMRNHRLDGRQLKIEYASASAVARSGTGSHSFNAPIVGSEAVEEETTTMTPGPTPRTTRKVRPMKAERAAAKLAKAVEDGSATPEQIAAHAAAAAAGGGGGDRKRSAEGGAAGGDERRARPAKMAKWEQSGRQAPGAALAMAKRAATGIVESKGTKVTFD